MKKLTEEDLQELNGANGCDDFHAHSKLVNRVALIAGIGSCFGLVGLAICGPTSLGLAAIAVICD